MKSLSKLCILNTRPSDQAHQLTQNLIKIGVDVLELPLLEITPTHQWLKQKIQFETFDCVIFTSPNAIHHFFKKIPIVPQWSDMPIFVIGKGSAETLLAHGFKSQPLPKEANSEGMLDLPYFQSVLNKKILLIKGVGGRQHLSKTLRSRQALLQTCVVYRRQCPKEALWTFRHLLQHHAIDIILLTSANACRHLLKLVEIEKKHQWLKQKTIITISQRIARTLTPTSVKEVIVTSYDNLLNTIKDFEYDRTDAKKSD